MTDKPTTAQELEELLSLTKPNLIQKEGRVQKKKKKKINELRLLSILLRTL